MKTVAYLSFAAILTLSACAAFPELDGQPTGPMRAADFQLAEAAPAPAWSLDFGDAGLRRMLAEADARGLDVASARARFRAADLTLAQTSREGGVMPAADASGDAGKASLIRVGGSLRYEPDLAGRFDAALTVATLDRAATGLDLWLARRTLAREVTQGWVGLAEARTLRTRIASDIAAEQSALTKLRARQAAGETTGADLAARQQALIRAEGESAAATTRIAVAEARLRALGVSTIPAKIALKSASRPKTPAQTDLSATASSPMVCAAWLRFQSSDAARAQVLAASRPRLVVTSSLEATAKTLAGLVAGNALALTNSVRVEGALVDNGDARARLNTARLGVAQAEIDWLKARSTAEITALDSVAARQSAEASLAAALSAHGAATADLARVQARHAAGMADGLELAEAARAIASAQRDIDTARAEALRAAAALHDALPPPLPGCGAVVAVAAEGAAKTL